MAKDERLYARFDIGMDEHPKVMLLSDTAFRTLIESTLYARRQLTDGFLAEGIVLRKWGQRTADELSANHPERPSWIRVEGGWQIRDYAEHQITRADIDAKREAGRKGGLAKAKQTSSEPVAPASNPPEHKAGTRGSTSLAKKETEKETEKVTSYEVTNRVLLDEIFSSAWADWPKKTDRADARKRFAIAAKKIGHYELAGFISAFGHAYAATTEKQFVPGLGTWLNRERWTDEMPTASTPRDTRQTPTERATQTLTLATEIDMKGIGQ